MTDRQATMTDQPAFEALEPGAVIGILGGGQLGRMLAMAACKLGLRTHIFAPEAESPAFEAAAFHTCAAYEDAAAVAAFARAVDVATYEFENIPAAALAEIERRVPVRPGRTALEAAQDRLREKTLFSALGIPTPGWRLVSSGAELAPAWDALQAIRPGRPMFLKRLRHGYDGKGQLRLASRDALETAAAWLGPAAALLEAEAGFVFEMSIIGARGAGGEVVFYDAPRNTHVDGVLRESAVPSGAPAALEVQARAWCRRLMEHFAYVGVMALEMFVVEQDGVLGLLANEMAPRVHNSGHWTIEACPVSQFENHIRAVAGWPLGDAGRIADARMVNLLGEEAAGWRGVLAGGPQRSLHLYGKGAPREGRKMGHYTELFPRKAP